VGVGADPCSAPDALSSRHRDRAAVAEIVCSCCERNLEQADVTSSRVSLMVQGTRASHARHHSGALAGTSLPPNFHILRKLPIAGARLSQARARPKTLPAARLFASVERHSSILQTLRPGRYKIVPYLIDLATHGARWVRAPEDFRPTSEHGAEQVVELVRHLLERYPTPGWLHAPLTPRRGLRLSSAPFEWYLHVAQGGNLRTAPQLPFPLTRRGAHEAMLAPTKLAPHQALLFGHLRACGGQDAVVLEILTRVGTRSVVIDPVWLELYEKIARTPDMPAHQVRPLCDYVEYRRFRCERRDHFVLREHGVRSLLKRMEEWHTELRAAAFQRQLAARTFRFAFDERWPSQLTDAELEGDCEHGAFVVTELRSAKELFEEGQRMHHCVATYTASAGSGTVSIWSLRLKREQREIGRVTIRVAVASREIVEARRFANQKIQPHEQRVLQRWAAKSGLTLPQSL
jgi:hypothetical protein